MTSVDVHGLKDRFTMVQKLGGGGMGIVYEAIDLSSGRHVALKTVRAPTGDALLRFKQEFRLLQDLHHHNLVTLGELIEEGGQWWFSMELVRGINLLSYVRSAVPSLEAGQAGASLSPALAPTLPPGALHPTENAAEASALSGTAADLEPVYVACSHPLFHELRLRQALQQLALGLHVLHRAHKVHRDIKPDNVLVTEEGRVVILDFGLIGESLEHESGILGTIAYMAPEQAAGRPVGPAGDWYSVGVLLYEALAGVLPFSGAPLEILVDKQSRVPRSPKSLIPSVPADLDALCMRLLAISPTQRPNYAEICELLLPAAPSSAEVEHSGAFFVGRSRELEVLHHAFIKTRRGQAHTVLFLGESGVGKSALVRHFAEQLAVRAPELLVLTGRCYEHESVPFKGVDGLIDALARTLRRWDRLEVEALLPRRAAALLQAFPVLGMVPALAAAPAGLGAVVPDPQAQRSLVFTALRELLFRLAERRPLLLLIEDLQWTDADSLALLASVMSPPDAPPLLLIATLRPGTQALRGTWLDGQRPSETVQHLELGQLPREAAMELAQQLAGVTAAASAEHLQRVVAEAEGHPLFIQELMRATRSGKDEIPRLDNTLWARIEDLPEPAQRLLRLCAVMGRPLPVKLATQASGLLPDQVERSMIKLRAANLLRPSLLGRDQDSGVRKLSAVEPYHDRVRELVVERLSKEERRGCHRQLAVSLEALGGADPEALSYHFHGAGRLDKAGHYAQQAANKAELALAFERAAGFYGQAVEWLKPEGERLRELSIKRAEALINAGHGYQAASLLIEAAQDAEPQRKSELLQIAGMQYLRSGYIGEGITLARHAFRNLGLRFFSSTLGVILSLVLHRLWLTVRGLRFRLRPESEISAWERQRIDLLISCCNGIGTINLARNGEFTARFLLRALRSGDPLRIAIALSQEAMLVSIAGRGESWKRGQEILETARSLVKELQHPYARAYFTFSEGTMHACAGNFSRSAKLLDEAETLFLERCKGAYWEITTLRVLNAANSYFLGNLRHLSTYLPRYLEEADTRKDRYCGAYMADLLARLRLMQDQAENSREEPAWRIGQLHFQQGGIPHINAVIWKANSFLYEGKGSAAHLCRRQEMPRIAGAVMQFAQILRIVDHDLRARCAIAAAQQSSAGRQSLLREAQEHLRALDRERRPWASALALHLRAMLAQIQGNRDQAAQQFERAAQAFDDIDMRLHAAVARHRHGQLLAGEGGRQLCGEAEQLLRAAGIKNPTRWANMLAPTHLG